MSPDGLIYHMMSPDGLIYHMIVEKKARLKLGLISIHNAQFIL